MFAKGTKFFFGNFIDSLQNFIHLEKKIVRLDASYNIY